MAQGMRWVGVVAATVLLSSFSVSLAAEEAADDPFGNVVEAASDEAEAPHDLFDSEPADSHGHESHTIVEAAESIASPEPTPLSTERRIRQVLQQRLVSPLDFIDTPLDSIMQIIADEYEIPVQFDAPALDAVAMAPDAEVSINIRGTSLASTLYLILRQLELTYVVDNEVLLITTEEEAATRLEVRVYCVQDLQDLRDNIPVRDSRNRQVGPPSLARLVTQIVRRHSWIANDSGEGEIVEWPGLLVVSNTSRVHEEIEELLDRMRVAKEQLGIAREGRSASSRR